ncbi:MAG: oxygen-independent coproporphyrinogen III oxidase [Bdellovibrionota bacterium]|jgi:oxygen-independent coproporphyrinogen-3 oxidase
MLLKDSEQIKFLSSRYAESVPRYTSYPTALELKPCSDKSKIITELSSLQEPYSLYVHIPYCKTICAFCACNRSVSTDPTRDKASYLKALEAEAVQLNKVLLHNPQLTSLHIGGGSPSFLTSAELKELDRILHSNFNFQGILKCEQSIELDPRTMTEEKAELLSAQGYTRASLGVQDFTPEVQKAIGRIQPYTMTKETVRYLRSAGFKSINIDLIYGLPQQKIEPFSINIDQVLTLEPDRIALYGYANVPWKATNQQRLKGYALPTPQERLQLFLMALQRFSEAGYEYIGLDHFALPNDSLVKARAENSLHRNFMGYSSINTQHVLAIGSSAISNIHTILYQNFSDITEYKRAISTNTLPINKVCFKDNDDILRASLIEEIMCNDKISRGAFCKKAEKLIPSENTHRIAEELFSETLQRLERYQGDNLVQLQPDLIQITPIGRLFVRTLASVVDRYLPQYKGTRGKVFSQGS